MPSTLSTAISALVHDVERVVGQYDSAATDQGPLSMADIVEACHRIDGLREPEQRNMRSSVQQLLSGLEEKISAKQTQIRTTLASMVLSPNRDKLKTLSVRHWRRLRWNVVDKPQLETEIEELRTMISLALSVLEEAVLSSSFSQPVIPTVAVVAPAEQEAPPIVPRGRFRVWPSSYTPETFRRAVRAASTNSETGLEIPHSAYVITVEPFPSRNGGYANVYRGKWNDLPIALKQLRSGTIAASSIKV